MAQRVVTSGSYSYNVNLDTMEQINVSLPDHTARRIQRCPVNSSTAAPPAPATVTPASTPAKAPLSAAPAAVAAVPRQTPTVSVAAPSQKKNGSHPVDPDISLKGEHPADFKVVLDANGKWFDFVLNQCNIAHNNNKYYRIQMLSSKTSGQYYVWFKWGRVGEAGKGSASTWSGPFQQMEHAVKFLAKKYRDKTGNALNADPFVAKTGKYKPIEIDNDVEVAEVDGQPTAPVPQRTFLPSALDPKTKELVEVLFSQDMRNDALQDFHIDLKRLPLGVPSQQQIQQGLDILREIENKLNGEGVNESYMDLSSRFYTAIPHSFGRSVPPIIQSNVALQGKYDMCDILLDMYTTSETIRQVKQQQQQTPTLIQVPNPVDQHYDTLKADLTLLDNTSDEFKTIHNCFMKTKNSHSSSQLLDVWSVHRESEIPRFQKYDSLDNRRLLWHGTNIAVVAPIITSGMRIMPHSGGRVGSGIYLAAMQEKSAQYTRGYGSKFACMFLCEAALGTAHPVTEDGPHAASLRAAPTGCDSVHAVGEVTPSAWTPLTLDDGHAVSVPHGAAKKTGVVSSFYHDEFLVYQEDQVRLRYILTVKL